MTSWVDPEDGLGELLALGRAPTADALHRVLVLSRPVRQSTDTMEPLWLLRRIAETEPDEVFTTAFLLLTDHRWRKGVSQLVRRIDESGCVDADDLDELAEAFLAADQDLYWVVPEDWFGDEEILVEVDHDAVHRGDDHEPDDGEGACVARQVHPPLRRWAAARLVADDPTAVGAVFERTGAVDARSAAAIMAGLLDVIVRVDAASRDRLIDAAIEWPEHGVRRAGIELVASRDGAIVAHELAARDTNARIREWAPTLLTDPAPIDPIQTATGNHQGGGHRDDQQSLF